MALVARMLALLNIFEAVVQTAPSISFPINSQVPPVARISQEFSFVFSSSTFTSPSGSSISYSLQNPPSWLSIDSQNRRLYGTPQDEDVASGSVVGVPIILVATDDTGSASLAATLVVSRNPTPTVATPVSEQIPSWGVFSEPSSILAYPDKSFSFPLSRNTFSDVTAPGLSYYAVMADNSPLPAWVTFDTGNLTFSGVTPPFASLVQPPQTFTLQLVASDIVGFSGASVSFSIVVGSHTLTVDQPSATLNATIGTPLAYNGLAGSVKVDGNPANPSDVPKITAQGLPSWLSLDHTSWRISGIPPAGTESTSFAIILEDSFSDILNVTFDVDIADGDGIFLGALSGSTLNPGEHFSYDLASYFLNSSDVDVTTDIQPPTSWITFDTSTLVLSGDVPSSGLQSGIDVTFTAKSKSTGKSQSEALALQILASTSSTSITTSTESASATPTSSPATIHESTTEAPKTSATSIFALPVDKGISNRPVNLLLAVLLPVLLIVFILAAGCIIFCCYWRRNRKSTLKKRLTNMEISSPIEGSFYRGALDAEPSSTTKVNKMYKIGYPLPPAAGGGIFGGSKESVRKPSNLRSEYTDSPTIPPMVFDAASDLNASPGKRWSWLAPLRNFRKRSNSQFSDHSLYDEDNLDLALNHPSMIIMGRGGNPSQSTFRDHLELNIPTIEIDRSVQQTPDMAYLGSSNMGQYKIPRKVSPLSLRDFSPSAPAAGTSPYALPPRTPDNPRQYDSYLPAIKHAKSDKSLRSLLSAHSLRAASMEPFVEKMRKAAAEAVAQGKEKPKQALKNLGKMRLDQSPRIRHVRNYLSPGFGPHTDPDLPTQIHAAPAGSGVSRRKSSTSSRASMASASAVRSNKALMCGVNGKKRRSQSHPGSQGSAGLGISYEDLVVSSPFHPSRTKSWSTVKSGLSGRSVAVTAKTAQSSGKGSEKAANWTVIEESPILKGGGGQGWPSPSKWREGRKASGKSKMGEASGSGSGNGGDSGKSSREGKKVGKEKETDWAAFM